MHSQTRKLPIRSRKTLAGDGDVTTARSVFCPTHKQAVALSVCGECARCDRIDADAVVCEPLVAERRFPTERTFLSPDHVPIAELMSRNVACVRLDVSVESIASLLLDGNIGAVPVVDSHDYPIGIVCKSDLARARWDGAALDAEALGDGMHVEGEPAIAADIMTPLAFTLCEDQPLFDGAAVMSIEGVHHLPVVSADGKVVGMLSSLDFVRWIAGDGNR